MFKRILTTLSAAVLSAAGLIAQRDFVVPYNNPDISVDLGVGLWAVPIPVDYDKDGKNDLLVNCPDTPYKGIWYFRNIGTNSRPFFERAQRLSQKASHNLCCSYVSDTLYIIDAGKEYPDFLNSWFSKPKEIKFSGGEFIEGVKKNRSNMWSYVDWDSDGDRDIIVGYDTWDDYGWDNAFDKNGVWTNGPLRGYVYLLENQGGQFMNRGRLKAGGRDIETYGAPNPCVSDFDADGDLDIICGEFVDGLTYYENIGSANSPQFDKGTVLSNRNGDIRFHLQMIVPRVFDFDRDGFPDIVVGDEDGRVALVRNTGKKYKGNPEFEDPFYFRQKSDIVKFGALATPCSYDWDNDGDEDIISGNSAGEIALIENLSGGVNPVWDEPELFRVKGNPLRIMAGYNGSIQGPAESKWGYTVLSVADWDFDGKADLVVNSIYGKVEWYRNAGGIDGLELEKARPVKVRWDGVPPKPKWNWWNPEPEELVTQWRTTPVVIDWNNDGVNDIIMLDHEGYLAFFEGEEGKRETVLKPGKRVFYCTNGSIYQNKKGMIDTTPGLLRLNDKDAGASGRRKICMTDWDCDGRKDLIVDGKNAVFFKNVSTDQSNTYFEYKGDLSDIRLEGHTTCPTAVDWDKNNVPDILVGAEDGHFYILENPLTPDIDERVPLCSEDMNPAEMTDEKGYIYNITNSELLVCLPEPDKATGIGVLVVPGGGYEKNCITYEGYKTAKWLNDAGIAAFILKYRLPDGNPEVILEDGRLAMDAIRKHSEIWNVDSGKIGVAGFSAGGHLAATLLTRYGKELYRPDFGILVYPVISSEYKNAGTLSHLFCGRQDEEISSWNADRYVHKEMSPLMILLCEDDRMVDPASAKVFYEAAVSMGVKAQIHIYPVGGHGFWMRDRFKYQEELYHQVIAWIKNTNK